MIYYLVTAEHRWTMDVFQELEPSLAGVAVVPYDEAAAQQSLARGTYIFSDLERLSEDGLESARRLAERVSELGENATVLNDPASTPRRYELLRALHAGGINQFNAFRLSDLVPADAFRADATTSLAPSATGEPRFPVFLREEREHTKNLTDLLHSWEDLRASAVRLVDDGRHRIDELLVVEWCDTSDADGVFRKYGAFVIGEAIVARHLLCATEWAITDNRLIDEAHVQEARDYVAQNPHADLLLEIAHASRIEYGRFDYAFLDGRPQIWEINTNPAIVWASFQVELNYDRHRLPMQRIAATLRALDARPLGRVRRAIDGHTGTPTSAVATKQTVCLCMIVRNEEAIIERCLHSVLGLIDSWLIIDTGSTDGTREIVRWTLGSLPGELVESSWLDFGRNRSELLERANGRADYLLLVDADMTVRQDEPLPALEADAYLLRETGGPDSGAIHLVRGDRCWRYEGSTHEYIATDGKLDQRQLEELLIEHHADGSARSREVFDRAQTYRELGERELAIDYYRRRVAMGGGDEEVFYANLQEGILRADEDLDAAVPVLLEAWQRRPARAEPLYELARAYRGRGDFAVAHMFASRGLELPYPSDALFIHRPVYEWGLRFERAMAAAGLGQMRESTAELRELDRGGQLPADVAEYVGQQLADSPELV